MKIKVAKDYEWKKMTYESDRFRRDGHFTKPSDYAPE